MHEEHERHYLTVYRKMISDGVFPERVATMLVAYAICTRRMASNVSEHSETRHRLICYADGAMDYRKEILQKLGLAQEDKMMYMDKGTREEPLSHEQPRPGQVPFDIGR